MGLNILRHEANPAGQSAFFIDRITGNVGIGTTTPSSLLHLQNSDALARQVIEATGENWREANLTFTTTGDPMAWEIFMDDKSLDNTGDADRLAFFHGETKMIIDGSSGNVGLGIGNPVEKLHVIGNIRIDNGTLINNSSREFKDDISSLNSETALETLKNLHPVTFRYKQEESRELHLGFIAEDVPDLVATPDKEGVRVQEIVAILTKVVQEQQQTIAELRNRIDVLESKH